MSLATVTDQGIPMVRTVLLKCYDEDGFVFFTEVNSRKVQQIASNPAASLLFPWLPLNRQVIVTGKAEKLGTLATVKCILMGENNGATSRAALEFQLAEIKFRIAAGSFSLAPSFCAFRISPETIEFWQGRGPREHDRFLYSRSQSGGWTISALP